MEENEKMEIFRYEKKDDNFYVYPPYTQWIEGSNNKEIKISTTDLESLIRDLLLSKKCKVEEYENGRIVKEGYPGNWKDFTDLCLDHRIPPSLCSIKISGNKVDLCFIRTTESTFYRCYLEDDDVFSNLYTVLSEINAYEILYDDKNLLIFDNLEIITHLCDKSKDALSLLKKFLKTEPEDIKKYIRPNTCIVDNNTLEALNIISTNNEKCILDLFHCYTVQGKRLLLQFFKQPLRNKIEIEARLNIIEQVRLLDLGILRDFPDILKITKKISKITLVEIIKLHQVVNKIPLLLERINIPILKDDFYIPLLNISRSNLLKDIEDVIDIKNSNINIKYNTDSITDLYKSLDDNNKECNIEYNRLLSFCDKIKYQEGDDFFRITRIEYKKSEKILKSNNILIINILKNGVNFTTKRLSELVVEKNNIKEKICKETSFILTELRYKLKNYINELEVLNYIIALLDVFYAIGKKSEDLGYTRPHFNNNNIEYNTNINNKANMYCIDCIDDNYNSISNNKYKVIDNNNQYIIEDNNKYFVNIKDGIHPLLEDKDCISNSLHLEDKKTCVITGPNMGGKSTFLKMIGIMGILSQVGCYVPAKYASLPIFDGIYIRIGANDCTIKGASTFMVEMKDISRICRMSTEKSLVLIDELGRGTSEVDGICIAKAVKDYLYNKKCITIFATHFPELCDNRSLNMKASFDQCVLNYKIVEGVCDTSWGITVAKLVGFPSEVLEDIEEEYN